VDKGYWEPTEGVRILRSGQKRGITKTLKSMIKRRSAIEEPAIGHMKMDGRLGRKLCATDAPKISIPGAHPECRLKR